MKMSFRNHLFPSKVLCAFLFPVLFGVSLNVGAQSFTYVPVMNAYAGSTAACTTATDSYGDGCPATQAILSNPWGSVVDREGNLYFSDSGHSIVRRVDVKTGIVTAVVGIPSGSSAKICSDATDTVGDGCLATEATLNRPVGLIFDPAGNLLVADYSNHRVRRVDRKTGLITTLVGTGVQAKAVASNSNPAVANAAQIATPSVLAFDRGGNLYITTQGTHSVTLVVAVDGVIDPSTSLVYNLAGTGTAGYSGDGGVSTLAQLNVPRSLSVDSAGNVLVGAYSSCVVRKITPPFQNGTLNLAGAIISTIAGTGSCGTAINYGGQATATIFSSLEGSAVDNFGNLYLAQLNSTADIVRRINLESGTVFAYAGNGTHASSITASNGNGGPAVKASLDGSMAISFGPYGESYISGYGNQTIRTVSLNAGFPQTEIGSSSTSQNIAVQALNSLTLQSAATGPAANSSIEFSVGALSGCSAGGSMAADAYCSIPVTFTPSLPGLRSTALVLADGNSTTSTLGLTGVGIAPLTAFSTGAIHTVAGTGTSDAGAPSGVATSTALNTPGGGVVDAAGRVYVADTGNNIVRRINVDGSIQTVAGDGTSGYTGDGSAATSAELSAPSKVAVDAAGNLYIADTGNHVIRFVSVDTGKISTVAGTGSAGYTGDSGKATGATFNQPTGLAVDRGGNVYVADTGNHAIRYFTVGGLIHTFAGTGEPGYSGDDGGAASATLRSPQAVFLDTHNNLFIADSGNGVIRMVSSRGEISTVAGSTNASSNTGDGGSATSATLVTPTDVVVDAAGAIYIASGDVVRLVNSAGSISTIVGTPGGSTFSGEGGLATAATLGSTQLKLMMDGSYNLYISSSAANRVLLADETASMDLNFTKQTPGSIGSAKTIVLRNTGNSDLSISSLSVPDNFALQNTDTTSCSSTTVLASGTSCTLNVAFSPQAGTQGPLSGNLVIVDNAFNNASSTQQIHLTGDAQNITPTTTTVSVDPSALTYGNTAGAVVTATVTGDHAPMGSVSFSMNGTLLQTVALSSGSASVQLPNLQSGSYPITASYSGDDDNASSSGSANIIVQPAVLTVTASNASMAFGESIPALTYTITGYVAGDTSKVVSGAPVETTTATSNSVAGTYPITLQIGTLSAANYTFNLVAGTLTVQPPPPADFSLSLSPATLTVLAGKVGAVTVSLKALYGYTGTAQLSCGDLPANVVCHFALPTLKGDPTATNQTTQVKLSVATDNLEEFVSRSTPPLGLHMGRGYIEVSLSLLACLFFVVPSRMRKIRSLLAVLLLTVCASGLGGCSETLGTKVAALGTSKITINATDSASKLTHSQTFTLVIQ